MGTVTTIDHLYTGVKEGLITPEEALEFMDNDDSKHISELQSELEIETLVCGIESLDKYQVFKKNLPELVVCGARPGVGKTALMLQIAYQVSLSHDVLYFNLEMRDAIMYKRIVNLVAKVPSDSVAKRPDLKARVEKEVLDLRLRVMSQERADISTIKRIASNWAKKVPDPRLIVVDYIQIIGAPARRSQTEEVKEVVLQLRAIAAEINCTVLTASQLNRAVDGRAKTKGAGYGDFTPLLSDLAESGSIEKDADVVFFLNRQNGDTNLLETKTDIVISKNRNGPVGKERMEFSNTTTRFIPFTEIEGI